MRLEFDGKYRYICPHCKGEQEWVIVYWNAFGASVVDFILEEGGIEPTGRVDFERGLIDFRWEEVYCPGCKKKLDAEDIERGFFGWLKELRKRDPKLHAEIVAELLLGEQEGDIWRCDRCDE